MIFFGVAVLLVMVLGCMGERLSHILGERVFIYIFFGTMMIISILGVFAYNLTPKRLVVPLGIACWIISFSILCWWAWFGPGALKM